MGSRERSIRLVLLGNTLEFFDLYLYIHLSFLISQKFFAPGFDKTQFFTAFTFTQLYLIAPIACAMFAYFGDKRGRKKVIVNTAMMMAIASLAIIFLPTYDTWGDNATILLILLRILQGIALAGEPTAANLYMVESTSLSRDAPWYKQAPWFIKLMAASEQVGGIAALLIGYASLTLFKDYTHGWRVPFVFCAVFVFFITYIRNKLVESTDYAQETSDKAINMFDDSSVSVFYQSLTVYYRNAIFWVLLLIPYPILFNICFLQMSPKIIKIISSEPESVLLYNAIVIVGSIIFSLLCAYFALRYKWNFKKVIFHYVSVGSLFAFLGIWCLEHDFNIYVVYICQILMMSLVNFGLVMPSLLKTFPIIGRYSIMGIGWGTARIINFFLIVIVMSSIQSVFGLYGSLLILYATLILGLYATYAYIPYEELGAYSFRETLKNARPIEGEIHIMTSEETRAYLENTV